MIKLDFICEFKSDIVLHSSSNTEGKIDVFNYIAGSNFLGMVARRYDDFKDEAFKVFHSGEVRFGDGHILNNNQETFHIPFSWFIDKNSSLSEAIDKNKLYNEHFISKDKYKEFIDDGVQLKQQRVGFFSLDGTLADIKHKYTQKSAFESSKRKSKDGAMYGYYALPKGTKWHFIVELEDEKYRDEIIKILESSKKLGKSKSAEYGRVKIAFEKDYKENSLPQTLKTIEIEDRYYIFLYAYSRLALFDKSGLNSFNFTLDSLKLDRGKIAFDKSHIRYSRYSPYNSTRHNRDFERLVIDKGSVIAIEVDKDFDVKNYCQKIENGIGYYLSEGHGKVIVNPEFITHEKPKFDTIVTTKNKESIKINSSVNSWLKEQKEKETKEYELLKEVKEFIKRHNVKNKKSQWGQIRSLCSAYSDDEKLFNALFSEEIVNNHKKGFLLHGIAKEKWDKGLIDDLKKRYEKDEFHKFVKLLSIYAPKEDDKRKDDE